MSASLPEALPLPVQGRKVLSIAAMLAALLHLLLFFSLGQGWPEKSGVLPESRVIVELVPLPQTGAKPGQTVSSTDVQGQNLDGFQSTGTETVQEINRHESLQQSHAGSVEATAGSAVSVLEPVAGSLQKETTAAVGFEKNRKKNSDRKKNQKGKPAGKAVANHLPEKDSVAGGAHSPASGYASRPGEDTAPAQPTSRYTVAAPLSQAVNPRPVYPEMARQRGQEGLVLLQAGVDSQGRLTSLEIRKSSGYALLDAAAVKAVRQWKFRPATIAGKTAAGTVTIPVEFRLR